MSKTLLFHYFILLCLLLGGGILIILLPSAPIHWAIIGFIGATYLVWAIWHHHDTNTFNRQTMLEYACIVGIIALVLLLV
jgi:hypothetical protein